MKKEHINIVTKTKKCFGKSLRQRKKPFQYFFLFRLQAGIINTVNTCSNKKDQIREQSLLSDLFQVNGLSGGLNLECHLRTK